MDHEAVCDCPFKDACGTYADSLIPDARKGPGGFGCTAASDDHRRKHCKAFACRYLSMVFSDMINSRQRAT